MQFLDDLNVHIGMVLVEGLVDFSKGLGLILSSCLIGFLFGFLFIEFLNLPKVFLTK